MYIPMGFIYIAFLYIVFQSVLIAFSLGSVIAFVAYGLLAVLTHRNRRDTLNGFVLLALAIVVVWIVVDFYATG